MEKHTCVDFLVFDRHSLQLQRGVFIEISILYSGLHASIAGTVHFSDESVALISLTVDMGSRKFRKKMSKHIFVFGCNHLKMTNCTQSVETAR